jgi:hypothetical protein
VLRRQAQEFGGWDIRTEWGGQHAKMGGLLANPCTHDPLHKSVRDTGARPSAPSDRSTRNTPRMHAPAPAAGGASCNGPDSRPFANGRDQKRPTCRSLRSLNRSPRSLPINDGQPVRTARQQWMVGSAVAMACRPQQQPQPWQPSREIGYGGTPERGRDSTRQIARLPTRVPPHAIRSVIDSNTLELEQPSARWLPLQPFCDTRDP